MEDNQTVQSIKFEDFLKLEMKFGTIITAERVEKSDKLLRLTVDFGEPELRQVVSGIGKTFQPEDLPLKQCLFVTNLPPRKIMGLQSEGMILATGEADSLTLVQPSKSVMSGSRVG